MNADGTRHGWCTDWGYEKAHHDRCPGTVTVPTDRFEANPDSTIPTLRRVTEQQPCQCDCHAQEKLW